MFVLQCFKTKINTSTPTTSIFYSGRNCIQAITKWTFYLFMAIGVIPMLFWTMTLLMPFRATILAFMMGSVMASKSANDEWFTLRNNHFAKSLVILNMNLYWQLEIGLKRFTDVGEEGVTGALSYHGLHLPLLLLLLPLLVEEVLQ